MADVLTPDICVIGGGPGGVAAARAAAASGVSVVLVEKKAIGGANLASGAVPLAALMAAASVSEALRRGPALGVSAAPLQVNLQKVRDHIAGTVVAIAAATTAAHLAVEGITVIAGRARFVSRDAVSVGDTTIRARRFILAVGARPAVPALPGLDNVEYLTPSDVYEFARKPSHVIVVGATAEGLALAQAHQRLGIDATVIDQGPLLPEADPELAAILVTRLAREGVRVRADVKVERINRRRGGVRLTLQEADGDIAVDGSHVLLAAGRRPATDGLALDVAGIAADDNGITVRDFRTANRRVYAIGDSIAGPANVVRAEEEGRAVVQAILFRRTPQPPEVLPWATATDPAIASVGLTEAEARKERPDLRVWRYPLAETARAVTDRIGEGVLKVVATPRGRILGAAALGREAGEHIALFALAMARRVPLAALADLAAAYPSRADAARALARMAAGPGLTGGLRKRIIRVLGKFG